MYEYRPSECRKWREILAAILNGSSIQTAPSIQTIFEIPQQTFVFSTDD